MSVIGNNLSLFKLMGKVPQNTQSSLDHVEARQLILEQSKAFTQQAKELSESMSEIDDYFSTNSEPMEVKLPSLQVAVDNISEKVNDMLASPTLAAPANTASSAPDSSEPPSTYDITLQLMMVMAKLVQQLSISMAAIQPEEDTYTDEKTNIKYIHVMNDPTQGEGHLGENDCKKIDGKWYVQSSVAGDIYLDAHFKDIVKQLTIAQDKQINELQQKIKIIVTASLNIYSKSTNRDDNLFNRLLG